MTGTNYVVAGVVAIFCAAWGSRASTARAISFGGFGQAALCGFLGLAVFAEGLVSPGVFLAAAFLAFLIGRLLPLRLLPAGAALQLVAMLLLFSDVGETLPTLGFFALIMMPAICLALLPRLASADARPGSRRRAPRNPTPRSV